MLCFHRRVSLWNNKEHDGCFLDALHTEDLTKWNGRFANGMSAKKERLLTTYRSQLLQTQGYCGEV